MKLSKTGIKVLTAQYRAILKRCLLINIGIFLFPSIAFATSLEDSIRDSEKVYTSININNKESASIANSKIIGNENDNFVFNNSTVIIEDSDLETKGNLQITKSTISYSCTSGNCEPDDDGPGDGFLAKNVTIKESSLTMGDSNNQNDYAYMGANKIFSIKDSTITLNSKAILAYEGDLGDDGKGEFNISGNSTLIFNDNSSLRIGEADNISKAPLKISDSSITLNNQSFISFFGNEEYTEIKNSIITLNDNSYISLNGLSMDKAAIILTGDAKNSEGKERLNITDVNLKNSVILGLNNVIRFAGNVDFSGLFDPAIADVDGNLTRGGYDDEITYNLNSGTLKYTNDLYLYEDRKHTHNINEERTGTEKIETINGEDVTRNTFSDGNYALNSINFNGGTLDIANGKATDIKLAKLTLSKESNIMLDADLANETMDRFSDDTAVEGTAKLNISKLNLISDAKNQETKIKFTKNEKLLAATDYTGATSGLTALSPIYSYDVAYDNTNGNFTFTRGGGNAVSDYNPAVYSTSVVGQSISFLQQNIANTAFSNISTPVPSQGIASGDMPKTNNAWVSMIGFDDNVDFDSFQTVDSEMYSVVGGVNSNDIDLKSGTARVGVYAGYLDGEQKYDGNKIEQSGGYIGLNSSLRNGNAVLANTINTGYIRNEAKHSFGTDKYDTYWTGIALKGGYDYHLSNDLTIQPNIYAGYSFVNSEDYTSKSGAKIENDNLHLFEVAPGVKVSKDLQNNWNVSAQAKYVFVMDNGGDINADNAVLPNISADNYVEYGLGIDKTLNNNWELSADINRRDGGREGWNGNISFKYNF